MAYEKVKDLSTDTVVKIGGVDSKTGKKNPTQMEGYYLGSRVVQTNNGESRIHVFQTPKGNIGVWGTKDLTDKLSQVIPGTMVLVEYGGKRNLKGGKTLHTYTVSQDKTNILDIETLPAGSETAGDESYGSVDDDYIGSDDDSADDEDTQQAAALLVAEQKAKAAKVQEILNRGKAKK
jgi:hypothetical protein